MQHTYFTTHWTPEEAHSINLFLDALREILMQTYGSEIGQWMQAQQASPFTDCADDPPF